MTYCHHHVKTGECPVCEATLRMIENPPEVPFIPLHIGTSANILYSPSYNLTPLCGADGNDLRFSHPHVHDVERFCPSCLSIWEDRMETARVALGTQWRARPLQEKIETFNHNLMHPSDWNALPVMLFKLFAIGSTLAIFVGFTVLAGWGAGLFCGIAYLFILWRVVVGVS